MLLTCLQCRNTFTVDDQAYAMQGGALCAQCQVPLVAADNANGGGFWQGQQPNAQWGQQPDAQWGLQPNAQWGQQPDAQWGQQPNAQWGQQPNAQWGQQPDAQWGQQPDAQWGQQPDAQWGQQPDAQWGQLPNAQWGQQPDAQWGQQPDAQWGQQPDAQWGQQVREMEANGAQWGQQPPGDAQWGQLADRPQETMAMLEPVEQEVVRHNDANERTVALSNWDGADAMVPPTEAIPNAGAGAANGDDDWGAWGGAPAARRAESMRTADSSALPDRPLNPNALVVGKEMAPGAHEGMTREIDAADVQSIYGDKLNPLKEFFRSLPTSYLAISGGVIAAAVIAFVIVAAVISGEPPAETKIVNGEIVDVNAPEKEKSFGEIARDSIALSASFIPFEGPIAKEGSVIAVADGIGVNYDLKKIAEIDDIMSGGAYVKKIADATEEHGDKINKPIVMLFGESMPMSSVYRTMYTLGPTMRKLYLGGTAHNGISTFEYHACNWPDHEMFIFESCKDVPIDVKITRASVTMRRAADAGTIPLVVLEDGTELREISTDIIGSKVQFDGIQPAIARLSMVRGAIRFIADGDVTFGLFMTIVRKIYGSADNPNVKTVYLAPVPLS